MKQAQRIIPLLVVLLLVAACGPTAAPSTAQPTRTKEVPVTQPVAAPTPVRTNTPAPTRTPQPSDTPQPTLTPMPTKTPTPEPTPRPTEPVILAVISGTGAVVTDNYDLPQCNKAVFVWTAQASQRGTASLIFKLYNVAGGDKTVVNEFETDLEGPLTGMELAPLKGGEYYFSSENTDLPWEVRVECHDDLAPVLSGSMVVTGTGNTVTGSYELPQCNKSVFFWQAAPTARGTASMIAYLCKEGATINCENLVNEFEMDLEGPLTGQALAKLSGGLYYLYVYNLSAPDWNITWECQD